MSLEKRDFLKQLAGSVSRVATADVAAELAFWSLLALFPFAMLVLTVVGYLPLQGVDTQLMNYVHGAMPPEAARLVERTVHEIVGRQRGTLLVLALLGAIWSASGGVSATITALNRAYEVEETRSFLRLKALALAMTVASAAMIALTSAALIVGPEIMGKLTNYVGLDRVFAQAWAIARWPIVVALMMLMLACLYYFLPNVKQRFRLITPGAVVAVLIWIVATLAFNLYVSHFNTYAKTYGALGAAVVLMLWLYISSAVVILGGEINAILDRLVKGIRHRERSAGREESERPRRIA